MHLVTNITVIDADYKHFNFCKVVYPVEPSFNFTHCRFSPIASGKQILLPPSRIMGSSDPYRVKSVPSSEICAIRRKIYP